MKHVFEGVMVRIVDWVFKAVWCFYVLCLLLGSEGERVYYAIYYAANFAKASKARKAS